MKKYMAIVLALSLILCLMVGCGSTSSDTSTTTGTAASTASDSSAAASADDSSAAADTAQAEETHIPYVFRAQTGGTITGTAYLFMEAFGEKLEEVSGGNLTMTVDAESSYDENQALAELLDNNVDFVYLASSAASGTIKDVAYLGIPGTYKYADVDDIETFYGFEEAIHDTMVAIYESYNARYLTARAPSMMVIETVDTAVTSVDDMQGLIIRVSGSWMGKLLESMGIATSTIQKGEVATALQRKTIDGAITGLEQYAVRSMFQYGNSD